MKQNETTLHYYPPPSHTEREKTRVGDEGDREEVDENRVTRIIMKEEEGMRVKMTLR